MRRVAFEYVRANPHKSIASISGLALAMAMLLASVGTLQGIGLHPGIARIMVGDWLAGLFLFIALIALTLVAIARYVEVVERTTELGILAVLGAFRRTLVALLLWETLFLALPGAIVGLMLTAAIRLVAAAFFWRILRVELALAWWPVAAFLAALASMTGGILALSRAVRDGTVEALSYRR